LGSAALTTGLKEIALFIVDTRDVIVAQGVCEAGVFGRDEGNQRVTQGKIVFDRQRDGKSKTEP
jgi:hypothetical protein